MQTSAMPLKLPCKACGRDYYPFGLTFNSYKRENSVENKIKFQGQEHIDDLGLNWDSFKWRNHQPDIGRFFNVDPLSEKYYYNSPYAFSENCVTSHVELEGLEKVYVNVSQYSTPALSKDGTYTIANVNPDKIYTSVNFTLDMGNKSITMGDSFQNGKFPFGEVKDYVQTGSLIGADFEPELTVGEDGSFSVHGDLSFYGATDVDMNFKVTENGLEINTSVDDISGRKSVAVFAGDETGGDRVIPMGSNSVMVGNTTPAEGTRIPDKAINSKTTIPLTGNPSKKIIFNESYKNENQKSQGPTVLEKH